MKSTLIASHRTLLATALLLGMAGTAAAQSNSTNTDRLPGGGYVGLSGGPSDFSRIHGSNGLFSNDSNNTAYSLNFGSYGPGQNLGFEVGYTNFGQVSRGGGTTKAEGINLSLIGRAPVGSNFNLLGKLGTTYSRTDVSANPLSGITTGTENGFDWSYGVGAELVITPQWSAVLNYDEAYLKFPGQTERVSTTSIGARVRF
jgi:OOP family OmpA-OmpF porin